APPDGAAQVLQREGFPRRLERGNGLGELGLFHTPPLSWDSRSCLPPAPRSASAQNRPPRVPIVRSFCVWRACLRRDTVPRPPVRQRLPPFCPTPRSQ